MTIEKSGIRQETRINMEESGGKQRETGRTVRKNEIKP